MRALTRRTANRIRVLSTCQYSFGFVARSPSRGLQDRSSVAFFLCVVRPSYAAVLLAGSPCQPYTHALALDTDAPPEIALPFSGPARVLWS